MGLQSVIFYLIIGMKKRKLSEYELTLYQRNVSFLLSLNVLVKYRKFTLDAPGVKVLNRDINPWVNHKYMNIQVMTKRDITLFSLNNKYFLLKNRLF